MDLFDEISKNKRNQEPRKIIRLLKEYGFEHRRTTGDHEHYKRPGFRTIPIPIRQNPLNPRIVKEVLNAIEIIKEMEDK